MFYDKDIEKFRSIKAPEELKAKIEEELSLREKKRTVSLKQISALAACFAVLFSFLLFTGLSDSKPVLMYRGAKISTEALCIEVNTPSIARAAISSGIPFEIKVTEETTLSVSEGGLIKEGKAERTEKLVLSDKGTVTVYLVLDGESSPVTLTAETEKKTLVYVLSYDEAKGYIIYKDAEIIK